MPKLSQKQLAAEFAVLSPEDLESLKQLRADAIAAFRPVNAREVNAVEDVALARFFTQRCDFLEFGIFSVTLYEGRGISDLPADPADRRAHLFAVEIQEAVGQAGAWKFLLRYRDRTEAAYTHALRHLERLIALRSKIPNEPISPSRSTPHEARYPLESEASYRQRMELRSKIPNEPIRTPQFTEYDLAMRHVARPHPTLDLLLRKPPTRS